MLSFGAFRSTGAALGGLLLKRRFRLTDHQKRRLNKRLKDVENNINAIIDSGVRIKQLSDLYQRKTVAEMTPREKYWVESKRYRNGFKPIHWVPHWTKVPHPVSNRLEPLHQPIIEKDSTRLPK